MKALQLTLRILDGALLLLCSWLGLLLIWALCLQHVEDSAILFAALLSAAFADYLLVKYGMPAEK